MDVFWHSKGCLEAWLGALINLVTTITMAPTELEPVPALLPGNRWFAARSHGDTVEAAPSADAEPATH